MTYTFGYAPIEINTFASAALRSLGLWLAWFDNFRFEIWRANDQ